MSNVLRATPLGLRNFSLRSASTRTRRYSTTLGALRQARADWQRLQAAIARSDQLVTAEPADTTLVLAHRTFADTGLARAEEWLAASLTLDTTEGGHA